MIIGLTGKNAARKGKLRLSSAVRVSWLEKAYEERSPWLTYLRADPQFHSLQSDPRFKTLLQRIGLQL